MYMNRFQRFLMHLVLGSTGMLGVYFLWFHFYPSQVTLMTCATLASFAALAIVWNLPWWKADLGAGFLTFAAASPFTFDFDKVNHYPANVTLVIGLYVIFTTILLVGQMTYGWCVLENKTKRRNVLFVLAAQTLANIAILIYVPKLFIG
jgi:hypothetical protein